MRCELAGIRRDDVSISPEHGILTIEGEGSGAPNETGTTYCLIERQHGALSERIDIGGAWGERQ
jgi:HSP20 family molecular chaperone IbpA